MAALGITLDNVAYKLHIKFPGLQRGFSFVDGGQGGVMQSGLTVDDTIGTTYSYTFTVEPDRKHRADYDGFFEAISSPNRVHSITLPYGQTTKTFDCRVDAGGDHMGDMWGSERAWEGLSVTVTPIRPQRMAEDET